MKNPLTLIIFALLLLSSRQAKDFIVLELYGNRSTVYYHIDINVGQPPQTQSVVVDTGSSLLVLQCYNCTDEHCQYGLYPKFEPNKNSQYVMCDTTDIECMNLCGPTEPRVPCYYRMFYGSYSVKVKGYYLEDKIQFKTKSVLVNESFSSRFICASNFGGSIKNKQPLSNGILGLGPRSKGNTLYGWFQKRGKNIPKVFSLCMANNGGYLELGVNPQPKNYQTVVQTTFASNTNYYINLQQIKIGKLTLVSPDEMFNSKIILDSGSPYNMLPNELYSKMLAYLNQICHNNQYSCEIEPTQWFSCYILDKINSQISFQEYIDSMFPQFIVRIGNKIIQSKPSLYLRKIIQGQQGAKFCLDFVPRKGQLLVLGIPWMKQQKFTFDLNQQIITIIPGADCQYQSTTIQYNTNTPHTQILLSYLFLLFILLFILFGPYAFRIISQLRNRLHNRKNELVEVEADQ